MLKECSREVTFDLAARAEYRDPERMERTVYVSPLVSNVTPDMVKVRGKLAGPALISVASSNVAMLVLTLLTPTLVLFCFSENVLFEEVWCYQVCDH